VNIDCAPAGLADLQRAQRSGGQCADTRLVAVAEIRQNIVWHECRRDLVTPPVELVVAGLGCDHGLYNELTRLAVQRRPVICIAWTLCAMLTETGLPAALGSHANYL
jgi:hypothetical protein